MTIHDGRAGPPARFCHGHFVASHAINPTRYQTSLAIHGDVDAIAGMADFDVPLERLTVDEPALRDAAGLTTPPSQGAIAGTRRNMLSRVLETECFPVALLHIKRESPDSSTLSVDITLHDKKQNLQFRYGLKK